MKLSNRLRRLEHRVGDPGCPACRDRRGRNVWVTSRRNPDGSTTTLESEPAPCKQCGAVPEFIIEFVRADNSAWNPDKPVPEMPAYPNLGRAEA